MSLSLALTAQNPNPHGMGKEIPYDLVLTPTGNYATGGDVVDFTTVPLVKASRPPMSVMFYNFPGGYNAEWIRATPDAVNTGKVKIYSASGTELTAGAYPAALTANDGMRIRAWFKKNL